jgi:lipopolysaccharide/colanic/teichoic acid biosynthesis glycosyltransferase
LGLPHQTQKNLRKAVLRLPVLYRERYWEEWQRDLEDIPGPLAKFKFSLELLRASKAMAEDFGVVRRVSVFIYRSQRCFDLVIASLALIFLAPYFLIIPIAIWLTSPGPIFVRYSRVGRDGRRFRLLRFRTMVLLPIYPQPSFVLSRLGRFLYKSRLNEIPQFLNIFRGQMNLFGPPPPRWE